ncbi:MAG: DUF6441 family protein [Rhodospirillales bacterium]
MRLEAAIRGDLKKVLAAELAAGERAVMTGVRQATDGLKGALRGQVTGAGLGQRLANTWRGNFYENQRLDAAGFVFSKAPMLMRVFATGAAIRAKHGRFLAIPLPAAGRYGDGRKKITPGRWEQATGQRLRFVYRRGRPSLLVADNARLNTRGRAVARKGKGGTTRGVTIPIFVLVPQVSLKKRFDVDTVARQWGDRLPALVVAAWRDPETAT